jgi:hypothetical protein
VTATVDASVRRDRVEISDNELDDLRSRIAETRWPERETVTDDRQGVPLALMQVLGGHFAAWEQPALFSAELRVAFRTLRSR